MTYFSPIANQSCSLEFGIPLFSTKVETTPCDPDLLIKTGLKAVCIIFGIYGLGHLFKVWR